MAASRTRKAAPPQAPALEPVRLAHADRREALLDAALDLVAAGDVDAISIESVADRAGVSRALLYKHFANRTDILIALYLREGARLHEELSAKVLAADTLEGMYRALFRGSVRAAEERGRIFEGLRAAAGMNSQLREVQRSRDRQTVAFYTDHAVREFHLPQEEAEAATAMLLGAIAPALSLWHAHPTLEYAAILEETYMSLVSASLAELRRRDVATPPRSSQRIRSTESI